MTPPARILVVNDDPTLGELLLRLLRGEGYAGVATADGRRAWAEARAAGEPFDLLVTNRFLPERPAADVLSLLAGEYPGAPILHIDTLQTAGRHGSPSDSAYTPFSCDLFVAEVERLLANATHRQSA